MIPSLRRKSSIGFSLHDNIFDSTKKNDINGVKKLLELSCSPNRKDQHNWTPLHYTCSYNNTGIAELLLNNNANINAIENTKRTPLHISCIFRSLELIELLLKHKADINCKDIYSKTPCHSIYSNNTKDNKHIINLLIKYNCNLEEKDNNGDTVLHLAAKMGDNKTIQTLVNDNENLFYITNNQNQTALHKSTFIGNTKGIEILLKANADVNIQDKNGKTPLHYTCYHKKQEIVQLLLKYKARLNIYDNDNKTPIQLLAERGSLSMLSYLLGEALTPEYQGICYDTLSPAIGSWLIRKNVSSPTTKYLQLQGTQLDWLPQSESFWQCFQELIEIDLTDNQLQTIPTEILSVPNIQKVLFSGNPLLDIPEFAKKNWTTLKKYLHNLHKDAIEWRERKIIIVGPANGGKSSVYNVLTKGRKIRSLSYTPTQELNAKTGVSFSPYYQRVLRLSYKPYIFSIWDICGNRETFPLLQCFLTSNSIYLIVFDITKWKEQRPSVDEWIQQVVISGNNNTQTPILFIATHRDCIPPKLVDQEIENFNIYIHQRYPKNRYRGILDETFIVSCKTKEGFYDLQELLEQIANEFHSIHSAQWKRVNDHLQFKRKKEKIKLISYEQYIKVCHLHGIKENIEIDRLTQYLKSIGTLDYFNDTDKEIKNTVILDTPWLSTKITELIRQGSCIGKQTDLELLITIAEHLGVIHVMNDGTTIIPNILPSTRPKISNNNWKDVTKVNSYFEYGRKYNFGFLPEGLFSRIISRLLLLDNIKCINMWRYGILIKYNNQIALIKHSPVISQHVVHEIDIRCQISKYVLYDTYNNNNNIKDDNIINPHELILYKIIQTINNIIQCYFPYLKTFANEWIPCYYCIQEDNKNIHYFHISNIKKNILVDKLYIYCKFPHNEQYYKPLWIPYLTPDLISKKISNIWHIEIQNNKIENIPILPIQEITPKLMDFHSHSVGFKIPVSFYNTENQYVSLYGEISHIPSKGISCLCALSETIIWIGYDNGEIEVYQITEQNNNIYLSPTNSWFAHNNTVLALCYICLENDEEYIWSSGKDGVIRVWNALTTIHQKSFIYDHEISCIKVSNNRSKNIKVWTYSENNSYISVYNPIDYSLDHIQLYIYDFSIPINDKITCMEIHHNIIYIGRGKWVFLIHIESNTLYRIWNPCNSIINGLHSVTGTNILLTWSQSPTILVWYINKDNNDEILEGCELTGHKSAISKCCTLNLQNQAYIWTCDKRGKVIIWDTLKFEPLLSIELRGKYGNGNILVRDIFTLNTITMITSTFCQSLDSCVSLLYKPTKFLKERISIDYNLLEKLINDNPSTLFSNFIAPGEKELEELEKMDDFKIYVIPLINIIIELAKFALTSKLVVLLTQAEHCTEHIRNLASLISNDDMLAGDLVLPLYIYGVTLAIYKTRKEFSVYNNLMFLQHRFLSFGEDNDACQLTHIAASVLIIPNLFSIKIKN